MLKILCVVDKTGTALDRLARGVEPYHENIDYNVVDVHPKRPDPDQLERFETLAMSADIIDWQYFRTAEMLRAKYEWLKDKKQILTHNNPYSIHESNWNDYDAVVANNESIHKDLAEITDAPLHYIPLTVDSDFWEYNTDWQFNDLSDHAGKYQLQGETKKASVIMVANRIEGKKGVLPVAKACAKAGVEFILVGAVSDMSYMHEIMATGYVQYHQQIPDEKLKELYYTSTIHVCNSQDNFESGTLPILEAMLCGTPVLTRNVGHVPDLNNGENMVILDNDPEDVDSIADNITEMLFDKKKLIEQREKAWQTAKTRNFERRAYSYQRLYRQTMYPSQQSVSVIMPIFDKPEIIRRTLDAVANQTYKNIELVIADDNFPAHNIDLIKDFSQYVEFPVRYMNTAKRGYGLARGRNEALIEATGDIVVFCDQRIMMKPNAIEEFVKHLKKRYWLYGSKGAKKEFVENFSCAFRDEVIKAGMFNERINQYGGQSQEIRQRIREQGIITEYIDSAKAQAIGKSSNRNQKRRSIIKMKNRLAKMYEL